MTQYKNSKINISFQQISKIVEMTDVNDRPEIAKEVKLSEVTVWKYQKILRLI